MKRTLIPWILILLAGLLAACAAPAAMRNLESISPQMEELEAVSPGADLSVAGGAPEAQAFIAEERAVGGAQARGIEPLVIRTANLTLVVKDPAEAAAEIGRLAEGMDGFVVFSNVYQTSYNGGTTTQASLNIRVPSERLDEALERIKEMAIEVQRNELRGEDVTQQYVDLQSRLRNLEAAEETLREIMASATRTEDVLQVYRELTQIREQIEMIKGQMQYFEDAARLASIQIELIPDELAQPLQIGGWRPQGTAKEALEALIRTLQLLANVTIWLVIYVLPVLLVIFGPLALIGRAIVRRYRRGKAAGQTREGEAKGKG